MTELIEQILRSVLVLALVWATIPATAEEAVGAIVLGMALCEVTSALTQTVLFRRYLGPRTGWQGRPFPQHRPQEAGADRPPLGLAALLGTGSPRPTRCSSPGCWCWGAWTRARRCPPTG